MWCRYRIPVKHRSSANCYVCAVNLDAALPSDITACVCGRRSNTICKAWGCVTRWGAGVQAEDAPVPVHVHMWDAVSMLCGARPSRDAVALSPLLPLLADRALGRGVPQQLRVAAMHALATCVGAEEIGSDADMLRALLCGKVRALLCGCRSSLLQLLG